MTSVSVMMVNNVHNLKFSTTVTTKLEFDLSSPESLSIFVRKNRRLNDLTATQLADKVGVHLNTIVNYESGRQKIPTHTFFLICAELGILNKLGALLCENSS